MFDIRNVTFTVNTKDWDCETYKGKDRIYTDVEIKDSTTKKGIVFSTCFNINWDEVDIKLEENEATDVPSMFGNGSVRYEDAWTEITKAEVPVKALEVDEDDLVWNLDFEEITNEEACIELDCELDDLVTLKRRAHSLAMDFFGPLIEKELLSNDGKLVAMYFSSQDDDDRDWYDVDWD